MFRELLGGRDKGNPGEARVYPTTFRRPLWVRPMTLRTAIDRLKISDFKVKQITTMFEPKRGLVRSLAFPRLRPTLDPEEILTQIMEERPLVSGEVVEWMQICGAENAVLQARMREYNRLGSELLARSTDPWLPGISVEDVYIPSRQTGSSVRTKGFAVASTPRGNFNIPSLSKSPGVFRDLISWGSISYLSSYQWGATLAKWKSLAETPIRQTVGFYRDRVGNVAPNFFVQIPTRPALSVNIRQRFSSDKDQTLDVKFRDPTNYSRVVGSKSVAVASGTTDVTYTVSAFPYVPPVVAEIQPEDKTQIKLEEFVVA